MSKTISALCGKIFRRGQIPTARQFEKALRYNGMSARQAKRFMAIGYKGIAPEAVEAEELAEALEAVRAALREG